MKTTPSYNLSVVVRETGIKPDTLRAWERRYGLPQPSRTDGGHRLYSERDIRTIRWLIERQNEGVRIKQAVGLWNEMESSGQDPLLVKPMESQSVHPQPPPLRESPPLVDMRAGWVHACLDFNEPAAENITNYALSMYPTETVCFEVLLAGLADIGEAWYRNEASVQQEHFASSLITRRLDSLIASAPPPTRAGSFLIGCPPGEDHTISPLTITLMLRLRGWRVIYLGANVPKARLDESLVSLKPIMVILTAQHIISAASLLDMAEFLTSKDIRVAFGGLIFNCNPDLHTRFPGYFLGESLRDAAHRIEDILTNTPPVLEIRPRTVQYQTALRYFRQMRPSIEAAVASKIHAQNNRIENLSLANHFMSQNIEATLQIGNMVYLQPEINWIEELIESYLADTHALRRYLSAFNGAAKDLLDQRGGVILEWLSHLKVESVG